MRQRGNPLRVLHVAAAVLLATGCNSGSLPRGEVSGHVALDGVPVTGGIVVFVPERGPQALGNLDESGQYRLQTPGAGSGAVQGQHTVFFQPRYDAAPLARYTPEDEMQGVPPPKLPSLLRPELPSKWLSLVATDLSATVDAGSNVIDFALTSEPPAMP